MSSLGWAGGLDANWVDGAATQLPVLCGLAVGWALCITLLFFLSALCLVVPLRALQVCDVRCAVLLAGIADGDAQSGVAVFSVGGTQMRGTYCLLPACKRSGPSMCFRFEHFWIAAKAQMA